MFIYLNLISFIKDHLLEFQIKVKFLFIFLGPKRDNIDYHEIGRCMGTLMTNRVNLKAIKTFQIIVKNNQFLFI